MTPLGAGDDHIHLPAAALGAHEPLAPIGNRRVRPRIEQRSRRGRVFTDDYLLGLMKDDVPRTCTYGRS
jgi:hypothetical protein